MNKVSVMTIEISDIQLFTLLKEKVGEREATTLIDYVKQETSSSVVKTKELLSKDISSLQTHMDDMFSHVDEKFKSQEQLFALKIAESKNEMMKAMYITSFIQIISIIGGLMALVKFMK